MTASDRRAREKEELRQKILDTARELFVAQGYDGVTLRKIAEAIEYAPGTIYGYFKDKDDLIRALCMADWETFEQSFPRDAMPADPLDAIRALGAAYIRFALVHPNHYRLMFMTTHPVEPPAEALEKRGDPTRDGYAFLRQTGQRAIDAGVVRPEMCDAELLAQTLWAGVHGIASLEIAMGSDPWLEWAPVEARMNAMLDVLIGGIARPRKAAR